MRLNVVRSKNAASLYVIKSERVNKVNKTTVVEKLGTEAELREKLGGRDPYEWAKEYIEELNRQEKEGREPDIIAKYSPNKQIEKDMQKTYLGGYLFLQKLYHELGLQRICADITKRHDFSFDLNAILSRLLYTRVLFPNSKRFSYELAKQFIEPAGFDLHQAYRALDVIQSEADYIQSELYKNSLKLSKRNTGVLYYDCTNYFFEIEQEDGLKQYGVSKEHRPNPIVQMGLFMDGDGIPLAMCIQKGNTNEQQTMKPLEKKILRDFGLARFVVCTDAGLSSNDNRAYNAMGERAFITAQSLKKLQQPLREWALEDDGWMLAGSKKACTLSQLSESEHQDDVFYKEQSVVLGKVRQRLIVTFSFKYKQYQQSVRENQIIRAMSALQDNTKRVITPKQNDYKRFISRMDCTEDGEVAKKIQLSLDQTAIALEAQYDGFYAVCTNLEDDVGRIIAVNRRRWEIEECFRIMKSEFKARPVYLSLDARIEAHFITCFLSLILYRYLEKRLGGRFPCQYTLDQLRNMTFTHQPGKGYLPSYTRNDFSDALHDAFGFHTDFEIVTYRAMKEIIRQTKRS